MPTCRYFIEADSRNRTGDPFNYERKSQAFQPVTNGSDQARIACKAATAAVYARDAREAAEINLVDAQWTSPAWRCRQAPNGHERPSRVAGGVVSHLSGSSWHSVP